MNVLVCLCAMASVMARWSACTLQNVHPSSRQLLLTPGGIQPAGNTNVFIFAQTNDYKRLSRVNLLLAGSCFPSRLFIFSFFNFCAVHKVYPIISATQRAALPGNKCHYLLLTSLWKCMTYSSELSTFLRQCNRASFICSSDVQPDCSSEGGLYERSHSAMPNPIDCVRLMKFLC